MIGRGSFAALIEESHAFHGQKIHADIGPGIARKKPVFRIIFSIVRLVSGSRFANMLMVATVVLCYRVIREPKVNAEVFQFGVSANNIKAFEMLNRCLAPAVLSKICINGRPFAFLVRLKIALSARYLWQAGSALVTQRHPDPLVHLQSVLAVAAYLVFSVRPLGTNLRVVCIASDHAPIVMGFLAAARQQGKATCYVQHAPVTEFFPPLAFDLSILYDRSSIEAYRKAAQRCDTHFEEEKITLLPPFNETFQSPEANTVSYQIGICLSYLPNMATLKKLIMSLSVRGDVVEIRLRRHPRCKQNWRAIEALPKVTLRPIGESASDFFSQTDIVLVPNSGVAIEALHCGRPTYFVPSADPFPDDYYGFVASKLLPVFSLESLDEPNTFFDVSWRERFLYHDETLAMPIDLLQRQVQSYFMQLFLNTKKLKNHTRSL